MFLAGAVSRLCRKRQKHKELELLPGWRRPASVSEAQCGDHSSGDMLEKEFRREKKDVSITASEITRASTTHVNREKNCSVLVEVVMLVFLQHTGNAHSATQPLQTAHGNTVRPL